MIQTARIVAQVKRQQTQSLRQPSAAGAGVVGVGSYGRPRPVELLGAAITGKRLQRVDAEPADVRMERVEPGRAAHVRDPRSDFDAGGDSGNRRIRHAQQDEIRAVISKRDAALAKPSRNGRADATTTDDADVLEHVISTKKGPPKIRRPSHTSKPAGARQR